MRLPDPAVRRVESRRFTFTAPLGLIEDDDLRWYLESYYLWPTGLFKARAERIEAQLPQWGQELYLAVIATQPAQGPCTPGNMPAQAERRFSVLVDSDSRTAAARRASCRQRSRHWLAGAAGTAARWPYLSV